VFPGERLERLVGLETAMLRGGRDQPWMPVDRQCQVESAPFHLVVRGLLVFGGEAAARGLSLVPPLLNVEQVDGDRPPCAAVLEVDRLPVLVSHRGKASRRGRQRPGLRLRRVGFTLYM
jgi:hypothetical protein